MQMSTQTYQVWGEEVMVSLFGENALGSGIAWNLSAWGGD